MVIDSTKLTRPFHWGVHPIARLLIICCFKMREGRGRLVPALDCEVCGDEPSPPLAYRASRRNLKHLSNPILFLIGGHVHPIWGEPFPSASEKRTATLCPRVHGCLS